MEKIENRNGYHLLDHGHVALVESMGNDLSIVRNARVSYDADWRTGDDAGKDEKLIRYLVNNNHTSPLESVVFTFDVRAPIFVLRQWMRHRTWAFNEISYRYTTPIDNYYVPELEQITTQHSDNKQMRTEDQNDEAESIQMIIDKQNNEAFKSYYRMIEMGCPRELARSVLPVGTYSHMFGTVNLHNLLNFIRLRMHHHAQYEIRVYALAMLKIVKDVCPIAVDAFCKKNDINLEEV